MGATPDIRIRLATAGDEEVIVSLIPRLVGFGPPHWRDAAQMIATDTGVIRERLVSRPPGTAIYVAEDAGGVILGFVHLQVGADYYKREEHGHVADVVVSPEAEGRGVGRLLMEKGEEWARSRGYRWLTLSVFAQNLRAREIYKRLGYGEDMMKYVKELD